MPSILIATVVTLGLVILIHELGHFAVCKWTGIYVKTFSIGFGPKLLRRRFGETEYAISVVPFGGYVKMAGEGVMEEIQDAGTGNVHHYPIGTAEGDALAAERDDAIPESRHFRNRPPWQRLAVVVAGPLANLALAFVIYTIIVLTSGMLVIPTTTVGDVRDGSPAEAAGLAVGDRIVSIDGEEATVWSDVTNGLIVPSAERSDAPVPVHLVVERDGVRREVEMTPGFDAGVWNLGLDPMDTRVGLVQKDGAAAKAGLQTGDVIKALDGQAVTSFGGIAEYINARAGVPVNVRWERDGEMMEREIVPDAAEVAPDSTIGRIYFDRAYESRAVGVGEAVVVGWRATANTITTIVGALASVQDMGLEAVGGPIRVGQVAGEMLRWSVGHLMQFIAFFSVNLFLLNLLPIPVLDGGHVVFILYEMIFRRTVHQRIQAIATQVGLIVLMLFMILVIVGDVLRVLPG